MSSSRISEDLTRTIPFGKSLFTVKIIIREWLDVLPDYPGMVSKKIEKYNKK